MPVDTAFKGMLFYDGKHSKGGEVMTIKDKLIAILWIMVVIAIGVIAGLDEESCSGAGA